MRRPLKEVYVDPFPILIREVAMKPYVYEPHILIGLRFRRKDKPDLIVDDGDVVGRYSIRGILRDTPETREALERILEIHEKISELQADIRTHMDFVEHIPIETLYAVVGGVSNA